MMRALLWLLGIFASAVGLAIALRYNDAYALFVWPPWRLHISMNLLAILMLAGFSLLYAWTRVVARALALPRSVAEFRARQKNARAFQALHDAQRLLIEGRYGRAYSQATSAYANSETPGLAALLAARAAHALRESDRCEEWLTKAAAHDNTVRIARLMTEAEFAIAERRFEDAAERLDALLTSGHRHISVLRLSLQTATARGMWDNVLRLARQLAKHHALTHDQATPLIRRAHLENMRNVEDDEASLIRYWNQIPAAERADRVLVHDAARLLNTAGAGALAASIVAEALDALWDSTLAELFGRIEAPGTLDRLALAEGWLKAHPEDERLLLTLARLCLQQQLWGKAQSYLEASLSVAPSRAAHLELARLAEQIGREALALKHLRLLADISE